MRKIDNSGARRAAYGNSAPPVFRYLRDGSTRTGDFRATRQSPGDLVIGHDQLVGSPDLVIPTVGEPDPPTSELTAEGDAKQKRPGESDLRSPEPDHHRRL